MAQNTRQNSNAIMVQPRWGWEDIDGLFPRWRKLTGGYVYLTPIGVIENIHNPQINVIDAMYHVSTRLVMNGVYCQICYVCF